MPRHRVATVLTPPPEEREGAEPQAGTHSEAPLPAPLAAREADSLAALGFGPVLLPRFGQRPLRFAGRLLFAAGNRGASPRWHEVAVYETSGGVLVLAIRQGTGVEGAPDLAWAVACDGAEEVRARLREHDPLAHLPSASLPTTAAAHAERRVWDALLATLFGGPAADGFPIPSETQP